jgi:alpha,alpha-trehalase
VRRRALAGLAGLLLLAAEVPARAPEAWPRSPQQSLADVFVAVQLAFPFADQKTFADATPREAPAAIRAAFRRERPDGPDALRRFVDEHFALPEPPAAVAAPPGLALVPHIDALWPALTRRTPDAPPGGSLLPLPAPYVVPGGRFRELYYWDSYFTMLGLAASGRVDLIEGMVRDFASLIERYGHVPNGTRTYYLSRSQPPFFFAMVALLAPDDPARAYARYLPALRREYRFWMDGERGLAPGRAHRRVVGLEGGAVLNRYWDDEATPRDESYLEDRRLAWRTTRPPEALWRDVRATAESGWDFSSRWFAGDDRRSVQTTALVPVDLNSLLYGLEQAIRAGCARAADVACEREFTSRARARRAALDRFLWDPEAGVFLDYRWRERVRSPRRSAAAVYPLWVGAASGPQAAAVARFVSEELLRPGGIVPTSTRSGEQWDAPNGWAPLQWLAVDGLRRSGQTALAMTIACRFTGTVARVYGATGKLLEKYDVEDPGRAGGGGEYPTQDGFGWTNGVVRRLLELERAAPRTGECPGA